MCDSILNTIKKMLGLEADYTPFDAELVVHINSAIMALRQIGVGPATGFAIQGSDSVWSDLIGDNTKLEALKSYIYLKVRTVFDPPSSSIAMDAIQKQIDEYEWRLNVEVDPGSKEGD